MTNTSIVEPDFFAERAARNLNKLHESEINALASFPEFRVRVISAFQRIYGEGAEVEIEIGGGTDLWVRYFRPTILLYSTPQLVIQPAQELIEKINESLVLVVKCGKIDLMSLKPLQFEEFVAELLKKRGYDIEFTKQTYDGGYDLFACKVDSIGISTPIIVQCKRYNTTIGVAHVRELHGVQTSMNIPNAMLATTSKFSPKAKEFVKTHIKWGFMKLVDRDLLLEWVKNVG